MAASKKRSSPRPTTLSLEKGDWLGEANAAIAHERRQCSLADGALAVGLDVLDSEDVWNVARVLELVSDTVIRVRYDGWPPEYDDDVDIGSGRIAPFHTFTWAVKCWVEHSNWPYWPSVVSASGSSKGATIDKQ